MSKPTTHQIEEFLDELRDGGTINMMDAVPHLQGRFGMNSSDARGALFAWMDSKENANANS